MNNLIIGSRIKDRRKELGLSQEEFSHKMESEGLPMSREVFSNIEKGKRSINVVEMNVIMKVLDLGIEAFLIEEEEEESLVTLFRKKEELTEEDEWFLEDFQMIVSALIKQEGLRTHNIERG